MISNVTAGCVTALTHGHNDNGKSTDTNKRPWVIVDIGFSGRSRSCGITINGEPIPDPVRSYRTTSTKGTVLGDKHYGMLCPAIKEWLDNDESAVKGRAFNLMIEAPLSMATVRRSERGEDDQGAMQGNPMARIPDRLDGTRSNGSAQTQQRLWYTQPASGLMVASMRLIQELAATLEDWQIRLFEGFVSFKEGNEPKGHWRDTCKLWKALPITSDSKLPQSRPVVDPTDGKVESILGLMGCERDNEIPPILRVTGPGAATVFAQPRTQRD
jgi:hypothetical protein